jgi:NMD protein affecting ribosome stability and mRNA decay
MTETNKHTGTPAGRGRQDRRIRELEHDPYHSKLKLKGDAVCTECGVLFKDGRWQWGEPRPDWHKVVCPACQRIQERVPAGFLTLTDEFLRQHREEIEHLIHNIEHREKATHPMKRIMAFEDHEDGSLVVTFTEPHLARAAGTAIEDAYGGHVDIQYTEDEYLLRVYWSR